MPTLKNVSGGTAFARFAPISSLLNNLPNGAGTIAVLFRRSDNTAAGQDLCGLVTPNTTGAVTNWYHALSCGGPLASFKGTDDDGLVLSQEAATFGGVATDWYIMVVTWAAGTVTERFHHVNVSNPAGWTHDNAAGNNGGNRAGPGTGVGAFRIGCVDDGLAGDGEYALVAAWAGVALSDAQCEELLNASRTSDWWRCSAGSPTLLVEGDTLALTDIGAAPSTFSSIGSLALTGGTPPWLFDGRGFRGVPYISDPFDRADGALTSPYSDWGSGAMTIISGSLWGSATLCGSILTGLSIPDDQFAQCVWGGGGSDSGDDVGIGLLLRASDVGSERGYTCIVNSTGDVWVGKYVAGAYTSLANKQLQFNIGDILRFEAEGTTLRVFQNGALILTTTDSSIASGSPGTMRKNSSGNNIDNFHAGALNEGPVVLDVVIVQASAASGSVSVEVPAETQAVIANWSDYNSLGQAGLSTKTLGGSAITTLSEIETKEGASDKTGIGVAALASPATGTQTFAWGWEDSDARDEGGEIVLTFIAGIDPADFIHDHGVASEEGGGIPNLDIDVVPGEMVLAFQQSFEGGPDAMTPATALIDEVTYNHESFSVGVYGADHSGTFDGVENLAAGDYSNVALISIKGGSSSPPAIAAADIFEWPGVFFFDISPTTPSDLSDRLDAFAEAGFKWAAAQAFDDTSLIEQAAMGAFRDAVRARGMYFGIWGVHHDDPSGDATRASSQIDLWGADFYIANAEVEYKVDGPGTRAHSATFVTAFRALQPDIAAALSTYGAIANETGVLGDVGDVNAGVMDFKSWYDAGFHAMPQAYASDATYVPDRVIRHYRRCRWPFDRIHPTLGIFAGGASSDGDDYHAMLVDETNTEYEHEVRADSPRALYKMQDASGNPIDMSPNGLNMTSVVGTPDYVQPGPFPGANSIRIAGGETLVRSSVVSTLTDNFTLELLVHVQAVGLNDMRIVYNGNSGSNGWGLIASVSRQWRLLAGGVVAGNFADVLIPDRFAHIVLVRRSGAWEIWMDGALASTAPGTGTPLTPSGTFQVGDSSIQEAVAFCAVYESALTAARIVEHTKAFGKYPPVCSPVSAYGFNLFLGEEWGVLGATQEADVIGLGKAASLDRCARRPQDLIIPTRVGGPLVRA